MELIKSFANSRMIVTGVRILISAFELKLILLLIRIAKLEDNQ